VDTAVDTALGAVDDATGAPLVDGVELHADKAATEAASRTGRNGIFIGFSLRLRVWQH
jgi:hypothetical protein